MRPFAALERFFERLFERPTARLFHTRLQPIQLQRRVERAMESGRLNSADRVAVPNRFLVSLSPPDLAKFGDLVPGLEAELADAALSFARAHHFTLTDRPRVRLASDPRVAVGDIRVHAEFGDASDADRSRRGSTVEPNSFERAAPGPAIGTSGGPVPPPRTMVFEIPHVDAPLAILRETSADGFDREVTVDGRPLTIGRATDNGLVLRDTRVSRYHGRLQARQGALVYTDLGSTNGSRVNGVSVDEVALGAGDRIEIGDTVLVVESAPRH
ncbi:MAG TPA: DUF3662 and FHA domain-containing protein [Candidatus Saccharimonadales bacterium]|nr:DUF3662 and FHA domain-containing protein [Candidatus Saccharimonadales bacterium]